MDVSAVYDVVDLVPVSLDVVVECCELWVEDRQNGWTLVCDDVHRFLQQRQPLIYKRCLRGLDDELVDAIKGLPKADGFDEILVPGEPEGRVYDERVQHGIPLPDGTVRNLLETAEKLGIPVPEWLRV